MQIIRNLVELPAWLSKGAVAIGNFDGVHLGHARIINSLREQAAHVGGPAVVFTFDPHPVRLLRPALAPPPLTWTDRKADLLAELGVDMLIAYPTDEALLALSCEEFFSRIVVEALGARAIVEGNNFRFGKNRAGDVRVLAGLCAQAGISLEVVEPVIALGEVVSSSRVRRLIADGDVDQARQLLTRPYRIRGLVTHGVGRGMRLGFPTANVSAIDTLIPGLGVYAGAAMVENQTWPAAIHLGPNPTFGESAVKVEVHLLGFSGQLYGRPVEVDFLSRLRAVRTFASPDELQAQLAIDCKAAREFADDYLGSPN